MNREDPLLLRVPRRQRGTMARSGPARLPFQLIGQSRAIGEINRVLLKFAKSDCPVLITGDTGTGKELVARLLHDASRPGQPFVVVDCAELAPSLIESELYGHRKGSFTGAESSQEGLFVAAGAGSLLLDEINSLSLASQAKLLRVLEQRSVRALGSTHRVAAPARVIVASNANLQLLTETGSFRPDLYYRLKVLEIAIPPLRGRPEDIPPLIRHFLYLEAGDSGLFTDISEAALQTLLAYSWPGNVRELKNALSAAIINKGEEPGSIEVCHVPSEIRQFRQPVPVDSTRELLQGTLRELEEHAIRAALSRARGNRLAAARALGIAKTTLYRKLKEFGATS